MSPAPEGGGKEAVTVSVDGDVAIVTLRRPPHNLLTEVALRQVADALHGLPGRARAAVLASEGRSFCAGADFRSGDAPDPTDEGGFETRTGAFYSQAARIYESPVPVVAAVQGAAIGAGFGLALACDVRVVGTGAWFQANFVRLGIHPGFALSLVLPDVIGPARASELFLTGRRIAADEAGAVGLALPAVPAGEEISAATAVAAEIAAGAPLAVSSTRATLRQGLGAAVRAAMRHELAEQTALAGTADAVEGVNAMLEGRAPRFEGR
ncbi:MAG TPA: enoyl-CoA hydratase/isomerase family protein [Acidimicrobiales bacterium]|nr:enoyl-CoA hydratase/isomerase family protein [Acidimicrobiales bacterium]